MSTTPAVVNGAKITLVFAEDATSHQRIKINSSGQAAIAGDGEASVGTVIGYDVDVSANAYGTVELDHQMGVKTFIAEEALAAGAVLYPAAGGKVKDTSSGTAMAIALDAATADGDLIRGIMQRG